MENKLNNPFRLQSIPPSLIIEKANLKQPKTLLDFGAGTALFSKAFIDIFPKLTVYACDIASEMIDWIKKEITPYYPSIIPIKLNDYNIPLLENSIDFLIMINVYHELDSRLETLAECRRVLQSKGKFILCDWKKEISEQGPSVDFRIDVKKAEKEIKQSGFSLVSVSEELTNYYLIIAEK